MLFLACMLDGLTGSFVRKGACSLHSSASHASFIHLFVNLSFSCPAFIHLVRRLEIFVGVPVRTVANNEMTSNLETS